MEFMKLSGDFIIDFWIYWEVVFLIDYKNH